MKGLKLLGNEFLAICRNRKLLVPIIAVLMVPVLYSGMFLGAFWDPYERLDQLPVAVVNMDEGATLDSKDLHIGDELVEKLKEEEEGFKWDFVDLDTAQKGLEHEKYYMMIKIPKNFSQNATTLKDNTPQHLELEYIPNESYNFLSSQIGSTAILKIKEKLSKTVTETYAEEIFDKIAEAGDGIQKAADGSKDLDEGVMKLQDGSGQVTDGLNTLSDKLVTFKDGSNKVAEGAGKVSDGLAQLYPKTVELNDGIQQLAPGTEKLNSGLAQLAPKTAELNAGVHEISSGVSKVHKGLGELSEAVEKGNTNLDKQIEAKKSQVEGLVEGTKTIDGGMTKLTTNISLLEKTMQQVIDSHPNLPTEQKKRMKHSFQQLAVESEKLAGGVHGLSTNVNGMMPKLSSSLKEMTGKQKELLVNINKLKDGSGKASIGLTKVSDGMDKVSGAVNDVSTGMNQVSGAVTKMSEGTPQLVNAVGQLNDGASQVAGGNKDLNSATGGIQEGIGKLSDGSTQVTDGLATAKDGTSELSTKLAEGAEKSGEVQGDQKKYEMLASPVDVKEEKYTPVPNYGTGFAPYFLSLGLFVGALLISIVFPLRESAGTPTSGFSWFISKFGVLLFVGIAQALISVAILLFVLGIEVQSVPLFILFSIITSLAFLTLVQFLVTALGDTGRFVAIIILILQLTTSAGTFPLELIPEWLQAFNAWLPMTYSVAGLKAVISSGDFSFMWENAQLLFIFIALAMAGTVAVLTLFFKRQYGTVTKTVAKEV